MKFPPSIKELIRKSQKVWNSYPSKIPLRIKSRRGTPKERVTSRYSAYSRTYSSNRKENRWVVLVFYERTQAWRIVGKGPTPVKAWSSAAKSLRL